MPLSEEERRAWAQLECSLVDGVSRDSTPLVQDPWTLTVPSETYRYLMPRLVVVVGIVVVLIGVLLGVPLVVMTGLAVLGICCARARRARTAGAAVFGRRPRVMS